MNLRPLVIALTLGVTLAAHAQTESDALKDPTLAAMHAELARTQQRLVLPGMQRPYYIEYRLEDVVQYDANANYGALTREGWNHQRVLRVSLRIGDYKQDSSSTRGDGVVQFAPADNNAGALRYALWFATDEAYKAALRAYSAKQAALKRFQSAPTADDYTPGKPIIHLDPFRTLSFDDKEWKRRIVEASGLYATAKDIPNIAQETDFSSSAMRALAVNRYLVTSEGTLLRTGYTGYAASISVTAQAPDGMRLSRDNGTVAATAGELESAAAFRQRTLDDLRSLHALRSAPVVDEEYHGPILFSADAATDILNRLFVPNVEADKPEMGTNARTQGSYTSSYRSRVLPALFSAVDDPRTTELLGKHLLGSYAVDDEGTPAQRVDVVLNGLLQNYLVGRTPIKDFPASNGHGRAPIAQAPQSRSGVMLLKPSQASTHAELEQKLLAMAHDQKRDFVFAAETLGGELAPRLLYRIYPDGHRELVRGAVFDELDQRSLRSEIIAAGDDPYLQQTLSPIPQTTIAPSLLFSDIGVKRASQEQEKTPYYPPPAQ